MIGKILVALIVCALVVFGIVWVMSGGLSRAIAYAKTINNPLELFMGSDSGGQPFKLPGQPDLTAGPDMSYIAENTYENAIYDTNLGGADTSLSSDPQTYGNPSPSHTEARLAFGDSSQDAHAQYLVIETSSANAVPLSLSGWSLQSVVSGTRTALPSATDLFRQGTVNTVRNTSLAPGDVAIVATGFSPVGVSFRENRCSGYLDQFQRFAPSLQTRCPSATETIPDTPENHAAYGDSCFAYMGSLRPCQFPAQTSAGVSPSCTAALQNALSYNACVDMHQHEAGFAGNTWRLFLGSPTALWRAHDTIRLLDEKGQVVDTLTY